MKNILPFIIVVFCFAFLPFVAQGQTIRTIAGNGDGTYPPYGDGGLAVNAGMGQLYSVAIDYKGNVYIADFSNNEVRKVTPSGIISLFAGIDFPSDINDGGPATRAGLNCPSSLVCDAKGNLFIADAANGAVRKVDTMGIITTVAGRLGHTGIFNGDGIPAIDAYIGDPSGICLDKYGNLYIADANTRIRKVDTFGIIHTVAGNGTVGYGGNGRCATCTGIAMEGVVGVAVDDTGNIYISEQVNNIIRKVNTEGIINVFAGYGPSYAGFYGNGGPATFSKINAPLAVRADEHGNIFIADLNNNDIRKVNTAGIISTVVNERGTVGFAGDGGPATAAWTSFPTDFAFDTYGNMFFADKSNHRIREVFTKDTMHITLNHSDTICGVAHIIFTAHEKTPHYWSFFNWQVNGVSVRLDTSVIYISDTVHDGDFITCQKIDTASGGILLAISDTVKMTVKPVVVPSLTLSTTGDTVCAGEPVTLSANPVHGGSFPVYQWYVFDTLTDSTGPTFTLTPGLGYIVTCVLNSDAVCAIPDTAVARATMYVNPSLHPLITIVPKVASTLIPSDTVAYWGQIISLFSETTYGGSSPTFQWYMDGFPLPGADSLAFSQNYYADHYLYCVMQSNAYCVVPSMDTSNTVHITIADLTTGAANINDNHNEFNIIPNPNTGTFTLRGHFIKPSDTLTQITIADTYGNIVYKKNVLLREQDINTVITIDSDVSDGFYLLKLYKAGQFACLPFYIIKK